MKRIPEIVITVLLLVMLAAPFYTYRAGERIATATQQVAIDALLRDVQTARAAQVAAERAQLDAEAEKAAVEEDYRNMVSSVESGVAQ